MQRRLSYLIAAVALVALAVACNRMRVIPKDDMVSLYKEMYMADQWIRDAATRMRTADTSYVYRPILAKYGYTEDDFRASIDYYTDRPKEFAGIFEQVAKDFKKAKMVVEEKQQLTRQQDSTIRAREALPYRRADFTTVPEYDFWITRIKLSLDTTINVFRFEAIDIFKDTLAVDSLKVASDSVKVAIDSIKVAAEPAKVPAAPARVFEEPARRGRGIISEEEAIEEDVEVREDK